MLWSKLNPCGFDFETSGRLPEYGLQPWRVKRGDAWATSLVWMHGDHVYGGLKPTREMMREMLEDAILHNLTLVGWNTLFDLSVLFAYGLDDLILKCRWLDAMLIWKHLEVEPEYDLNRENKQHWKLKEDFIPKFWPTEAGYEEGIDYHDDSPEMRAKLHAYNIRDVGFTLRAGAQCWHKLTDVQQRVVLLEAQCLPLVAQANVEGMLVDTLATHDLQQHLLDVAEDRGTRLAIFGCTEEVVRSPAKLAKLLFDDWKLPVLKENKPSKKTGRVTRSTGKEVLHELFLAGDGRAKLLREYREALGNVTKFAEAPLKSVAYNEDDRTHPTAFVFSTYSGRMTYASTQGKNKDKRQTGWALHQAKKGKEFRSIIIPPEGYTLVEFDADGQEFKWMAVASGDETMLQLCLPDEDAHAFLGSRITGCDYRKLIEMSAIDDPVWTPRRKLGKVGNLSLQYRTSAPRLRSTARTDYDILMTMDEAELIHATYRQTYTKVPMYWRHQIDQTKRQGYVETLAGRRVRVVGDWNGDKGWSMGSTAINYRIQGTGAEQKYLALAVLRPYLVEIGARFGWDLHDGLYFYVPDAKVQEAMPRMKAMLDNLPYERAWGIKLPIKMTWSGKAGGSWGDLKGVK